MLAAIPFALRTHGLRRIQRATQEQIRSLQQERWQHLLQLAMDRSPFYRQRLRGIDPRRCRPGDIPPLTKAEMMANFDALVTDPRIRREEVERFIADPANLGKFFLGRYAVCHTSGSQGQPALVLRHRRHALLAFSIQVARASKLPGSLKAFLQRMIWPGRVATVTQKPGFYPSGSTFAYVAAARLRLVNLLRLSVFDPIDQLVAGLNDFQPQYLSGYTGALESLAREQLAGRLRLRGQLQLITSHAEPLPESSRNLSPRRSACMWPIPTRWPNARPWPAAAFISAGRTSIPTWLSLKSWMSTTGPCRTANPAPRSWSPTCTTWCSR
jgi:phenylacetate-coenzyme A ligase PaaK-like adenylate-forming protein